MSHLLQQLVAQLLAWQGTLQSYGWLGLAAFAGALIVLQMALVPLSIFAIAGGAIFGFGPAFIAVTIGTTLGAVVNFLLARYVARLVAATGRGVVTALPRNERVANRARRAANLLSSGFAPRNRTSLSRRRGGTAKSAQRDWRLFRP